MPAPAPMRSTPWQRTHVVSGQAAAWARIAATSTSRSPTPRTSCQWGCSAETERWLWASIRPGTRTAPARSTTSASDCVRTRQQVAAADGDDPVVVDEHDLGARRGAVHREDGPAGERAARCRPPSAELGEQPVEGAEVVDELRRAFEGSEVAAALHLGPVHDVVALVRPRPRRLQELAWVRGVARSVRRPAPPTVGRRRCRPDATSAYRRAADPAVSVTQYTITLSSSRSQPKVASRSSSRSLQTWNFSRIQAASPDR